jgi:sigma-54-dependent transcriptional regulator
MPKPVLSASLSEVAVMLADLKQPLVYAEALLGQFTGLSRAADGGALLADFVRGVAQLSGCELTQLYLLDANHDGLGLNSECLDGILQPRDAAGLQKDYSDQTLLQFALRQNRVVCLGSLRDSLHGTDFLPIQPKPWQSLLCVPLLNQRKAVEGLVLCASHRQIELQGFAGSLGQLGAFALHQVQLLQRIRQPNGNARAVPASIPNASGHGLIGKSPAMRRTYSLINKVVHTPYTVLLLGETGTGKEVVARAIHDAGPRRSQAFIVQNCAAFAENLLESELFGYRKGAFTGADRDRPGLFDAANGGTLFLDEVGDMPLSLQAKLLRVLQEGEIRPLGCNETHKVDVRIIAATHRDLPLLVREGKFREDLYYRLAQFPIALPALRQREGDILDLARYFSDKACALLQRDAVLWSDAALGHLAAYTFPGNVRELKGMVERALLLCEGGDLLPGHFCLPMDVFAEDKSLHLRERLEQFERNLMIDCLRKNNGNQTRTARELGLPRRTLLYRLGRLNICTGNLDG